MESGKIFVCYRRDDTAGDAGRLYDRLNQRFPGRVFMDVAGISLATRWADVIEDTLRSCQVAVILIGKRWLEPGPDGVRRIDVADDPTRGEITTALRLVPMGLKIVPLVVAGAAVPDRKQLPPDVAPITDWQAHRIDHEDFDHDASRLVRELERVLGYPHVEEPAGAQSSDDQTPPRRRPDRESAQRERVGWFGLTLGSLKVWITVGVAAMAFMIVGVGSLRDPTASSQIVSQPSSAITPTGPGPELPPARVDPPDPTTRPGTPPAAPPSLDGTYALETYSMGNLAVPVDGEMRLQQTQPGIYLFATQVTDRSSGTTFYYTGVMQGEGSTWTTTTSNTNDPTAVFTPIVTDVRFDGSRLLTRNAFGQSAVWRKQS